MILLLLSLIHNITTLLFGIFISAFFLGISPNKKNLLHLSLFSLIDGIIYYLCIEYLDISFSNQIYPLLVHIPLILFLCRHYHYAFLSCCTSVFSAYLCCQFSNWIGLLVLDITQTGLCYYIARIVTTCIMFIVLFKYVCKTTEAIFLKDTRELCIIGFLPFIYYVFDYASTKFSALLYSGNKVIVEFMGFAFSIAYLVFLVIYFREYEKKQEIRQYSDRMEIQLTSIQKEIEQVRNNEETLTILRHDMRHHLNLILSYLKNGYTDKAIAYITQISNAYDNTIIKRYCLNETLNSVISLYQMRFREREIDFQPEIMMTEELPCPDLALCTILSNALENSMHALEKTNGPRWVTLSIFQKSNHLLLEIKNPIKKTIRFVDGIPVSSQKGHGIGVKSIVYYVQRLNGQCDFSVFENCFILKIIL